jgi:hypothetical protein
MASDSGKATSSDLVIYEPNKWQETSSGDQSQRSSITIPNAPNWRMQLVAAFNKPNAMFVNMQQLLKMAMLWTLIPKTFNGDMTA